MCVLGLGGGGGGVKSRFRVTFFAQGIQLVRKSVGQGHNFFDSKITRIVLSSK